MALLLSILDFLLPLALTVGALWPLLRAVSSGTFRRCFKRHARLAGGIVLAGIACVVVAAFYLPPLHWWFALGALGIWIFEVWRGRTKFGRTRGLPPGSLERFPKGFWDDHLFFLEQALEHGRVFKSSLFIRPMVCIVDLQLGLDLLRLHDRELLKPAMNFDRIVPGGFLCYMSDDAHSRYRPVLAGAFSKNVAERQRATMGTYFSEHIEKLGYGHEASPDGAPLHSQLKDLVFYLWLRVFFGIDEKDACASQLHSLYQTVDIDNVSKVSIARGQARVEEILDVVLDAAIRRRTEASRYPQYVNFLDGAQLETRDAADRKIILGNLAYILYTSNTDVCSLLYWLLKMLGDHPQWLARLEECAELDAADAPGANRGETRKLAECIVLETLRLEQSEYLYRGAHRRLEIGDYVIPKGWLIRICLREAHRHPEGFPRAGEFDPERFLGERPDATQYLPFGGWIRACPASHFTIVVATEFLVALASEFRWKVVEDGPRELNEWMHWAPSSSFQIQLQRHLQPRSA